MDVDALVDRLCDLSADERAAFWAAHDVPETTRREVDEVLRHYDAYLVDPEAMPARDAVRGEEVAAASAPREHPPRVGPYTVLGVLGAGGMGVVYRARQAEPSREVAIKLLHTTLVADEHRLRFEREAELLGRMQHPGVAQIHELGRTAAGAVYLVMEAVDGLCLTDWCREQALDRDARLRLLVDLGDAVHHAHVKGVVHRDLKPSNVLVTPAGQVKVIDFGVARALDRERQATLRTAAGQIVGTLAYMAPEQVRGDVDRIDARADVYALGVLAYELLARRLPHELEHLPLAEAARVILERDPPPLGQVAPDGRGDLTSIVGKALEKDPERRYASAAAFAADIRRFLSDEPVEARPASTFYQLRKLARRHRALVGGVVATVLALAVGAVIAIHQAVENKALAERESRARADADDAAMRARAETSRAEAASEKATRSAQEAEAARAREAARAAELDAVASYQQGLLEGFDAREMGAGLRGDLMAGLRADLERRGLPAPERDARLAESADLLDAVDLVGVATSVIDRSLLAPAERGIEELFPDQPLVQARLLESLATAQARVGLERDAFDSRRGAVDRLRETLGDEHADTLRARVDLAGLLARVGDDAGSLREFMALCGPLVERLGPTDPATVQGLLGLASGLFLAGDTERSLDAYAAALEAAVQAHGEEGHVTLIVRASLGRAYFADGQYEEAERLLREVLEQRRDELLDDAPPAVGVQGDLGATLVTLGRVDEGLPLLREACERARRRLGNTHVRTVELVQNLAACLATTGHHDEALPLYRELLAIARGPATPPERLVARLNDLSALQLLRGEVDEAASLAREAMALARDWLPEGHPVRLDAENGLRAAGEPSDAVP